MKKMFFVLVSFYITSLLNAQTNTLNVQTPCTTTAQGTAGNFIISYTIGEMPLIQSWQSNGLLITQGVLQPGPVIADTVYECYGRTEVKVYPNPSPGVFSLRLSFLKTGNVKTLLFDASGKLLQTNEFAYHTFSTTEYNIQQLASGVYYLQLYFTETGSTHAKKCVYTIQKIN
ncbi:T9SS type A sorting domain-containing protein [Ferruginibacter sp.]|nr:T9SS type A sorting domain-containing protein [Ferruginibacter sp.]